MNRRFTFTRLGFAARLTVVCACLALVYATGSTALSQDAPPTGINENVPLPKIIGPWWTIAQNPDLGPLTGEGQVAANCSIWQAADGSWQLWSHLVGTKTPGEGRLIYRWQGAKLTDTDWTPMGIAIEADPGFGETLGGLQSPFVIKQKGEYLMVYGDWRHICLARSWDGKSFARQLNRDGMAGMFAEPDGARARDPMLLPIGNTFYLYYVAAVDGRAAVYCRTSTDLRRWSDRKKVLASGTPGSDNGSAAGPFVFSLPGDDAYYLFQTHASTGPSEYMTSVYWSRDPLDFGVDDDRKLVATLPTEVVRIFRHDGDYYILSLMSGMQGYKMASLEWALPDEPSEAGEGAEGSSQEP